MFAALQHVPDEVERLKDTGIFDIAYTHLSSHTARAGISKSGKLMAPALALANGLVPFSGEYMWYTYLFRAYHVSVSEYPHAIDDNHWRRYIHLGNTFWTPESSEKWIVYLEQEKERIKQQNYCLADVEKPSRRAEIMAKIDGCIELEQRRQERYDELTDEERRELQNPQP